MWHSRDQHKPNFGTKFLFGWATVTTRNFRSFSIPTTHYSSVTIHRLLFTGHYSSFYYSSFLDSVCDSEKRYYSYDIIHPKRKSLFMITIHVITHFIVNGVYGYSNSHNRLGLAANSYIICKSISHGLEIVYISFRRHLHTIPLVGFTNLHFSYIRRITYIHFQINVNVINKGN